MRVDHFINDVMEEAKSRDTRQINRDAFEVLTVTERVLRSVHDWNRFTWNIVHANPLVVTTTGVREYPLPKDFPLNFMPGGAKDDQARHMVKVSDGSSEYFLEYFTPAELLAVDLETASNNRPASYTILTNAAGQKILYLDPAPDSNSNAHYTIRGAYRRRYTDLQMTDVLPAELVSFLKYGTLVQLDARNPVWAAAFNEARAMLFMEDASQRKFQMVPGRRRSGVSRPEWE